MADLLKRLKKAWHVFSHTHSFTRKGEMPESVRNYYSQDDIFLFSRVWWKESCKCGLSNLMYVDDTNWYGPSVFCECCKKRHY